jgi:hypothetical protein
MSRPSDYTAGRKPPVSISRWRIEEMPGIDRCDRRQERHCWGNLATWTICHFSDRHTRISFLQSPIVQAVTLKAYVCPSGAVARPTFLDVFFINRILDMTYKSDFCQNSRKRL